MTPEAPPSVPKPPQNDPKVILKCPKVTVIFHIDASGADFNVSDADFDASDADFDVLDGEFYNLIVLLLNIKLICCFFCYIKLGLAVHRSAG